MLGITILSGSYSHLLVGDGFLALEPWVTFVAFDASPDPHIFHPAPGNAISRRDASYANKHQPIVSIDKAQPASEEKQTMKFVVLGATGGTGLETVRQAIEHGHSVTAFVRSPERLKPFGNRITIKQGDLLNPAELAKAINGHDAILSGFGPRVPITKDDANLLRNFATALTTAMHQASVRRAVIVSTAFLFKDSIVPPTYLLGRLLYPGVVIDATAMEQIIMESGLDWTIVRPPQLTDTPFTGKYRVRIGHLPGFGFKISRADVAHSFLKTAEDPASIRKIVGVSN